MNNAVFIVTAVKTSNLTFLNLCLQVSHQYKSTGKYNHSFVYSYFRLLEFQPEHRKEGITCRTGCRATCAATRSKLDHKEMRFESVDYIHMTRDRVQ
jgi:hypothetical protein